MMSNGGLIMRNPVEISFHGVSRSAAIEDMIKKDAEKLERVCDDMVSCRVGIKLDQKSRATNNPFKITIEMRVPPGHNLVVTNSPENKGDSSDLKAVLKTTFKTAQRRLKQLVEKRQGDTKHHHEQEVVGIITKIFADEGYGFLRTLEGDEMYFHRNSVVNEQFDRLEPGTGVNYTAVTGNKGLQASSVQVRERVAGNSVEEAGEEDYSSPLGWQRKKR